jgi:hypothetical protein
MLVNLPCNRIECPYMQFGGGPLTVRSADVQRMPMGLPTDVLRRTLLEPAVEPSKPSLDLLIGQDPSNRIPGNHRPLFPMHWSRALKDRECHVPKRLPFKSPLGDLQQTTTSFGLDNDGGDDGDASDASSRIKAFLPNQSSLFFEQGSLVPTVLSSFVSVPRFRTPSADLDTLQQTDPGMVLEHTGGLPASVRKVGHAHISVSGFCTVLTFLTL